MTSRVRLAALAGTMLMTGGLPSALLAQQAAAPVEAPDPAAPASQGPETAASTTDAAAPAPQDEAVPGEEEFDDADTIVVTGARPPGEVIGDIKPEIQLSPADIRAYGASSIAELLDALAPQTGSARGRESGRPVVLLNGRRISGFSEIRDLPPEAILRVDILPEEAALSYGYRADQRVVNFVLRPRFRSYTGELEGTVPTAGGTSDLEATAGLLRISDKGRFNLQLEAERNSRLLESERNIASTGAGLPYDAFGNIAPVAGASEIDPALSALAGTPVTIAGVPAGLGDPPLLSDFVAGANRTNITDVTPFRTLRPADERYSANAVLNRTVLGNVSATLNLSSEVTHSESLLGLPGAALQLPATNPFSPFDSDVQLYRLLPGDPLSRVNNGVTANAALGLNGNLSDWQWSVNANYARSESRSRTERSADFGALQASLNAGDPAVDPFGDLIPYGPYNRPTDTARSVSNTESIDALIAGAPFELPAGPANLSVRVQAIKSDLDSRSVRAGIPQSTGIGRDSGDVRVNLSLPIADARRDVLSPLGDLSLNGNAEVERVSDFGTLTTLGYGFNWTPVSPVRVLVSVTHEEGAPSSAQLGNPVISTPNVTVFDYVRGESVLVTQIDGGNPGLVRDTRDVFKAGLTLKPKAATDLVFSVDYVDSRLKNTAASFPSPTAEIEAAFPDRFTRDADGRLIAVDNRPVNFARDDRRELRWGFNLSLPIKSNLQRRIEAYRANGGEPPFGRRRDRDGVAGAPADAQGGAQPAPGSGQGAAPADGTSAAPAVADRGPPPKGADGGPPPGGGGEGGRGGFGGGRGGRGGFGGGGGRGDPGGRLQFAFYHTWHLEQSILIRDGLPRLDLLDGSATGSSGGQSRHNFEFQSGYSRDGFGIRLNGNYATGTHVDGGTSGGDRLDFSGLATFDLRLFANLGQQRSLVKAHPFLRGSRISLSFDNIFDSRQRVTDSMGDVPLTYQPGYVDPIGRTVKISFRKLFF